MFLKLCTIALVVVSASVTAVGQRKTCDLKLKVFSYDALNSPKKRLLNVSVQLKGKGSDETLNLTGDLLKDGFTGLGEGTYKLEFQKSGYGKRSKQVDLDCDFVDKDHGVWNYTYLWRDKKSPSNEADLIADEPRGPVKSSDPDLTSASSVNKVFGKVIVKIVIDVDGNVVSASRVDGEKKLTERAIGMARLAKFSPTFIKGVPYPVTGNVIYNFAQ